MKEEPKVLTRMRLSCCWGDNLNKKELNEVVDYINNLQSQLKAQEDLIKEARKYVEYHTTDHIYNGRDLVYADDLLEILSKGENKEIEFDEIEFDILRALNEDLDDDVEMSNM